MWNDNHVQKPRHLQSVQDFVFHCCLKRSLRQQTSFLQAPNGFVVIILPTGHDPEDYKRSVTDILHSKPLTWDTKEANYFYIHQRTRQEKLDGDFASEHQRTKKLLALAEDRDAITPMIKLAADAIIDLCPISARDLRAACRVVLNLNLTEAQAQDILAYPLELVWPVLRPGRSVDDILRRLFAVTESQVSRKPDTAALPLSAMHGYGSAQLWGLELAEDLRDWAAGSISWSDVDKGIVLSGPPGVGKTVYARALAQECGVELVATSFSRWQATGHLGDLLRAMRSDFARAKSNAPSVLFIDELDSVGDRARFSADHRSYSVQVVNAFLECLDGLDGREGVVVVGATNQLEEIDPAVLRPGRLDRHVKIPLPSAEDRIRILAQQLDGAIEAAGLDDLRLRTSGMTGADLAKAARDAKRAARRQKRTVMLKDIEQALPAIVQLADDHRRANAIHEVGHTIVGLRVGNGGQYVGTTLADTVVMGATVSIGGQARFSYPAVHRRDRTFYEAQIAICLAGIAAERLLLGNFSDGAGMQDGSDLAVATRLATMLEAQLGMGTSFRFSRVMSEEDLEQLRRRDPALRIRVDRVLADQFRRAEAILAAEKDLLERLANELVATGSLTPERVAKLEADLKNRKRIRTLRAS